MTPKHAPGPWQPFTGVKCSCRPGVWRENCPTCEGTGWVIDFRALHAERAARAAIAQAQGNEAAK